MHYKFPVNRKTSHQKGEREETHSLLIEPQPPVSFLRKHSDIHPVVALLLWQRGIRASKDIQEFLHPVYRDRAFNAFKFHEMEKVVERIVSAANKKERIIVYGDYDVDGVTSSILLIEALEKLYGDSTFVLQDTNRNQFFHVYLPHREEDGYGLSENAVNYIKAQNVNLVITCDCGTANIAHIQSLQDFGIDVIVLDHHTASDIRPPAFGFINPKYPKGGYPFKHLAACGVVFKVVQALRDYFERKKIPSPISESFEKWSLDLVTLATVADMMPLCGENRMLVKWGLVVVNKTKRLGLQALIHAAGIKKMITTHEISFALAPRINAAGRMDHANVAFDLLLQKDKNKVLSEAEALNRKNLERQKLTEEIYKSAREQIMLQVKSSDRVLVAYNLKKNSWPTGVLGLVAGRLSREFNCAAFVVSKTLHGIAGSGRSINALDITAGLKEMMHFFEKFGGHPQACGFTLTPTETPKNLIEEFKKEIELYARRVTQESDFILRMHVHYVMPFSKITWQCVEALKEMEPFGEENPRPIFLTQNVFVEHVRLLGKNSEHIKLILLESGSLHEALIFRSENHLRDIKRGDRCDIIYTIDVNEWNSRQTIQLNIQNLLKIKNT